MKCPNCGSGYIVTDVTTKDGMLAAYTKCFECPKIVYLPIINYDEITKKVEALFLQET